jgi:hypothetical protein
MTEYVRVKVDVELVEKGITAPNIKVGTSLSVSLQYM